jgi:hypothetical protein
MVPAARAVPAEGDLRRLSDGALAAAAQLCRTTDGHGLASFLYLANWVPFSPVWARRFPDVPALEQFLVGDDAVGSLLARRWRPRHDAQWFHWEPRTPVRSSTTRKLYVSSRPDDAADVLRRTVEVMADGDAPPFKVTRLPRGLLRPDRLVVYVRSSQELDDLAAALEPALTGYRPQGVPFTASAGRSGIVSWGVDPPASVREFGASWRRWVTRKLAAYLCASDADDAPGRAAFARARIHDDGVDPASWAPTPDLWAA